MYYTRKPVKNKGLFHLTGSEADWDALDAKKLAASIVGAVSF